MSLDKKFDVTEEDIDKLMTLFGQLSPANVWNQVQRDDFTVRRFA